MCILADNKKTICGKFTTNKKDDESQTQSSSQQVSNPYKGSSYRKEISNFVFGLKDCRRSDASVICSFVISNKGDERGFSLSYSQITNSTGKSYELQGAEIGGGNILYVSTSIAPGINYNGTITFGVPEGINQVPLLKIGSSLGTFQFRNIAFSN